MLPNEARRSPDAAWITPGRLRKTPTCPEFIIELLSPFDSRKKTDDKMLEWMSNGVQLGWLIDPCQKTVTVYRTGSDIEISKGTTEIPGEGPIESFVLDLREIWNI